MKDKAYNFFLILVFFVGLSVLLYPSISNYWNDRTQTQAIIDYEKTVMQMGKKDYEDEFVKAENYNKKLTEISYPLMNYDQINGYEDILNINHDGVIGYLLIEKLDSELPIYHGTSDPVLNVAVGLLEGTSFPIGGKGTHAVLSAHRGLPSAKLFSDLDKLEIGDCFSVVVLDRSLTYEVDQILIVEPSEVDALKIMNDEEHCSLVTCTPYGINTHRLILRGTKIEDVNYRPIVSVSNDAFRIEPMIVAPIVAVPILILLILPLFIKKKRKEK